MSGAKDAKDAGAATDNGAAESPKDKDAAAAPKPAPGVAAVLAGAVGKLEEGVLAKDTYLVVGRLLRQTQAVRSRLTAKVIEAVMGAKLPAAHPARDAVAPFLAAGAAEMDEDDGAPPTTALAQAALPETEMYVYLVTIMWLLDGDRTDEAERLSCLAVDRLAQFNRRTLDQLGARIYSYFSWAHERNGKVEHIRSKLLALQRTAVLRHDESGQETLLNLLLRSYLHSNLYDHAEKLRSKTQLDPSRRNMHQYCRYLYYVGRIRAIQLEYSESKDSLQQALRKAPQGAKGFRVTLHKWLAMVSFLLGEVPDRTHFTQAGMRKALLPYFELAKTIRTGDVRAFQQVAETHAEQFLADKTHNLIVRLQHNVLRTGLRRISKAYSKVSLADVAQFLGLASAEEAEWIVAKAVRDGAVDARIDHTASCVVTDELSDIYSTFEPQRAFHGRTAFCLDLHNEAVRAMRYKPNEHKLGVESEEARKERLQQEQELAKSLEEEDF